jgi:hypothetical protein
LKASVRRLGHRSFWQRSLLALTLVAFALQSYITQTHIHFERNFAAGSLTQDGSKALSGDAVRDKHDKYPANEDPANCPICQEILYAGHYVAPTAIAVLPPSLAVSTIAIVAGELPSISAASHNWRGRAPPRI